MHSGTGSSLTNTSEDRDGAERNRRSKRSRTRAKIETKPNANEDRDEAERERFPSSPSRSFVSEKISGSRVHLVSPRNQRRVSIIMTKRVGFHKITRNTIFEARSEGKGFLTTTIIFSLVLKRRKSVRHTILHTRLQWIESVLGHSFWLVNFFGLVLSLKLQILS